MSAVFYRKWRPQRLDQVVGQEWVSQTLLNAVKLGRVAHAYLFCGPRGTGKTSTARILAKAINCLTPQDGEPDNECEICVSINETRSLDLIEIDAASNRGIDDIRNLKEKVHYVPNAARNKVYIVDEVHMLTSEAFNALLKTLEEPPAHATFILATTEAHKVPLTIISRCQRFDFRRIPQESITTRLEKLCADETVTADNESLRLIAREATGSLRDAENLLEQALISYGSPLREQQVRDLLEIGNDERALELVSHIVDGSMGEGLAVINEVAAEGNDLRQFHRMVMDYLRGMLLSKSSANGESEYPEDVRIKIKDLTNRISMEHIVKVLKTFAEADLRQDSSTPLPLELAVVEAALRENDKASLLDATASRPSQSQYTPSAVQYSKPASPLKSPEPSKQEPREVQQAEASPAPPASPIHPPAPSSEPQSEPLHRIEAQWDTIVKLLRTRKGKRFNLGALLRSSVAREVVEETITLKYSHSSHKERMEEEISDPEANKILRDAFTTVLEGDYQIRATLVEGANARPQQSASQSSHLVKKAKAMGAQVVGEKEAKENG